MGQQLGDGESLARLLPQEALEEALGFRGQALRQAALAPADFGKQRGRVGVVEGVTAHQHGVEHDAQAPHVGHFAGVRGRAAEDLRADVRGAAVGVRHGVIGRVLQDAAVLEGFQPHLCPINTNKKHYS